jgi:hypothetical protein
MPLAKQVWCRKPLSLSALKWKAVIGKSRRPAFSSGGKDRFFKIARTPQLPSTTWVTPKSTATDIGGPARLFCPFYQVEIRFQPLHLTAPRHSCRQLW